MPVNHGTLKIGSVVDNRYVVLRQIGKGGMSTVYLALNEKANKTWAIKEVKKAGKDSGQDVRISPMSETRILKRLRNKHLPSIVDIIDRPDTYLIIMDFIEGKTLKKILDEEGEQPQEKVVDWAIQLCDVLTYLHTQDPPIIYRDMKPANIMLEPDGNIVLIDFGTAREYKQSDEEDTIYLGTRGYAAPEQYGGSGQTDERTDIYNLGATMYHLLTGHNPSKPPYEMRPIREFNQSLSSGLESIILKCTKNDPEERYQSADELKFALEHYEELDNSYKRKKKFQIGLFIGSLCCSAAMFISAFGVFIASKGVQKKTYQAEVTKAEISADLSDKEKAYQYAIQADPTKQEAYMGLLENVYLVDGNLSKDEADTITELLGFKPLRSKDTVLDSLKKNKKAYGEFSYQMGLAYFYYYEKNGNKQLSLPYFKDAAASGTLSVSEQKRAERFEKIASYYAALGDTNKAGDSKVSYKDYWNDLTDLTKGNLVQSDNVKTALVMYRELSYQIASHGQEFKQAGVSEKAMEKQIQNMTKRLKSDIEESSGYDENTDPAIVKQIEENLRTAESTVRTVYSKEGGETDE